MASDQFQMINILLYSMIDEIIIQMLSFDELLNESFFCFFFKSILPLDFTCLLSTDEVRGIYFWRCPCICPSIPSVHTSCPSVTIS